MNRQNKPLIAVDIGNSRIKLGLFSGVGQGPLPSPTSTLAFAPSDELRDITRWLDRAPSECQWLLASVNRNSAAKLTEWLTQHDVTDTRLLVWTDLPLKVELPSPERVGIDRLANATAANRLRHPTRPAAVVDLGSAITVDLVSSTGTFRGGAILPGIGTSARALAEFTDLLPRLDLEVLDTPPAVVGINTEAAIQSGLYWGPVGAIRELVRQFSLENQGLHVFLTGGASAVVAGLLDNADGEAAVYLPDLTLRGIACAVHS